MPVILFSHFTQSPDGFIAVILLTHFIQSPDSFMPVIYSKYSGFTMCSSTFYTSDLLSNAFRYIDFLLNVFHYSELLLNVYLRIHSIISITVQLYTIHSVDKWNFHKPRKIRLAIKTPLIWTNVSAPHSCTWDCEKMYLNKQILKFELTGAIIPWCILSLNPWQT